MFDHITYQVCEQDLNDPETQAELKRFMSLLHIRPTDPGEDPYEEAIAEHGWNVLMFRDRASGVYIHLVGAFMAAPLGLSHFCVVGLGKNGFDRVLKSSWVEHYRPESGRCWLRGPLGLRVEVRP